MTERGNQVFHLPDGGCLWEARGFKIELVGDRGIPSPVIYQHPGGETSPGYELRFEVWNGIPVCTEVRVTAQQDHSAHVRALDVKNVARRIEDSLHEWLSFLAYTPTYNEGGRRGWKRAVADRDTARAAKKLIEAARSRRKITPELLDQVAATHRAATGAKTEAVATAFGVSIRTAWRYVEKAREEGFLDE